MRDDRKYKFGVIALFFLFLCLSFYLLTGHSVGQFSTLSSHTVSVTTYIFGIRSLTYRVVDRGFVRELRMSGRRIRRDAPKLLGHHLVVLRDEGRVSRCGRSRSPGKS